MPRRKMGIDPLTIVIALIIMFLVGKFLGLWKAYGIDPFGLEFDLFSGVIAVAIGVMYKEIKDLNKQLSEHYDKLSSKLLEHGERIAKLEAKSNQND